MFATKKNEESDLDGEAPAPKKRGRPKKVVTQPENES